jgi:hypothetical protein
MKEKERKRKFESEAMVLPAIKMVLNDPKSVSPIESPEPLRGNKKPVNRAVVVKLINKLSRKD